MVIVKSITVELVEFIVIMELCFTEFAFTAMVTLISLDQRFIVIIMGTAVKQVVPFLARVIMEMVVEQAVPFLAIKGINEKHFGDRKNRIVAFPIEGSYFTE